MAPERGRLYVRVAVRLTVVGLAAGGRGEAAGQGRLAAVDLSDGRVLAVGGGHGPQSGAVLLVNAGRGSTRQQHDGLEASRRPA